MKMASKPASFSRVASYTSQGDILIWMSFRHLRLKMFQTKVILFYQFHSLSVIPHGTLTNTVFLISWTLKSWLSVTFSISYSLPKSHESPSFVYFTFVIFRTSISSFSLLILIQTLALRSNIKSSVVFHTIAIPNIQN